ncbi:MAG: flavodoxin family protein [Candidatus Lokiarchaeota archaeon]|nr:flavodoxin family protein [Candidatus Lokiarchaeota archaeon]
MKNGINIIGLISSPHKNGSSANLTREVLNSAERKGANIEELYLPDYNIEFCKGCMNCLRENKCILKDDLNLIREKLESCHGIVISSPTYGIAPNGMMMNFIQRIGIYSVYRSSLAGKYIIGIATAGAIGAKKVAKYLTEITDGLFDLGYRTGVLGAKLGHENNMKQKDRKRAYKLGSKLIDDIKNKKKYRIQKIWNKILTAILIKPIMKKNLKKNKDTYMKGPYNYLHERGVI